MLKKILSQSTLGISVNHQSAVLTPSKKHEIVLFFENTTEYDMPLSVNIKLPMGVYADSCLFDVTVPAFGNTQRTLTFDVKTDALMFCGEGIVEISAFDRVLETTDVFEMPVFCEMSYRCDAENLFSRNGVFYINSNETLLVQFVPVHERDICLYVLSGEVFCEVNNIKKNVHNPEISLNKGINTLCIKARKDSSFCFTAKDSDDIIFVNTINAKNFVEE